MLGQFHVPSFGMKRRPWWATTKMRIYRVVLDKLCRDIMFQIDFERIFEMIRKCFWEKLRFLKFKN